MIFHPPMHHLLRSFSISIIANSLAVWAVLSVLSNHISITADPLWKGIVLTGITIGVLNTLLKPMLKLLTLPVIILTLGLFLLVINALIIWMLEWLYGGLLSATGITILIQDGFLSYLLIGLFLAIINSFLHWLLKA